MPPKGKKKDPNAPTEIPEDTYVRVRKMADLKITPKPPKGELTEEEWSIPPAMHSMPEFKQAIQYWKQCAIVSFSERDLKAPTRMKALEAESTVKKTHPRKELQDLMKYIKGQVKQANKRTGQFLKQLGKKEGKETKRQTLLANIENADNQMNEELRSARRFAERQEVFDKRYMVGTKLGEMGPRKNALIAVESTCKQGQWIDETKDEVTKLLNQVIENHSETFNVMTFTANGQTTWCPTFQSKTDPKKGLEDALKWTNKNVSAKVCGSQPHPPDFIGMLRKATAEGQPPPWRIFLCCSRSPDNKAEVLELIQELRSNMDPPAKGEPVLPINIVAFDPSIVGDAEEKAFFDELAGPPTVQDVAFSFMDPGRLEDLVALDKMLKAVQVKKKQLDKLNKKLLKMEDLSERVAEDRSLLQMQVALLRMLENDFELTDWALKNETVAPPPDI